MRIRKICPICIEWNEFNGFVLHIIDLDFQGAKLDFEACLFGLNISQDFFIIEIFFFRFDIKSPFRK